MTITKMLKRLRRDLKIAAQHLEDNGFPEQAALLDGSCEGVNTVRADFASLKAEVDMDMS